MSFPACKHRKKKTTAVTGLRWLASEPFRLFFFSGAVWSIIGVSLWPLFYAGKLSFYPAYCHAHLMIEAFGGAFAIGFLGTAGPRMASAPKLTPLELFWLFTLHQAGAISHLQLHHSWGDALFATSILSLISFLLIRIIRFRKELPPPQMALALTGLLCGAVGGLLCAIPSPLASLPRLQLASLLLYQGFLLPPILGIGSFIFPRILGGAFGDPTSAQERRQKFQHTFTAAALLIGSFFIETSGYPIVGSLLRAATCAGFLLLEIRWPKSESTPPRGSLANGLPWALITGVLGLVFAGFFIAAARISIEHLLFISGFGLVILIVASRVLFGHSGDLPAFAKKSKPARWIIFLALLAAITRATPAFVPSTTISHHIYAACTWAVLTLIWILWHRRRFLTREDE